MTELQPTTASNSSEMTKRNPSTPGLRVALAHLSDSRLEVVAVGTGFEGALSARVANVGNTSIARAARDSATGNGIRGGRFPGGRTAPPLTE
jgi:hypothetical protein